MANDVQTESTHSGGKAIWPVAVCASVLALLSASCCVLPLGLAILGVSGSALTFLGPFVAYRTSVLLVVGIALLASWIFVARRLVKGSVRRLLVVASMIFGLALSAPLWEQDVSRSLWAYWQDTR